MKCNEAKTILSEYIDGLLNKQKAEHLKGHLLKCKACKEEFFLLKSVIKSLVALKPVKAPDNFLSTLYERIEISSLLDVLGDEKQPLLAEKSKKKVEHLATDTKPGPEDISERIEELLKIGEEALEEKKDDSTALKAKPGEPPEKQKPEAKAGVSKAPQGPPGEWDVDDFKTMEFSATSLYNVLDEVLGPDEEPLPKKPEKTSNSPTPEPNPPHDARRENGAETHKSETEEEADASKEQDDDEAMKCTYVFDMGIPAGEFDPDAPTGPPPPDPPPEAADDEKDAASGNRIKKPLLIIAAIGIAGVIAYAIYTTL